MNIYGKKFYCWDRILNTIEQIFDIIANQTGKHKNTEIAQELGVSAQVLGTWKKRGTIPYEKICEFAALKNLSLDHLLLGKESKIDANSENPIDTVLLGDIAIQFEIAYKAWVEEDETAMWILEHDFFPEEASKHERPSNEKIDALLQSCSKGFLIANLIGTTYKEAVKLQDKKEREKAIMMCAVSHAMFLKNPHIAENVRDRIEQLKEKVLKGDVTLDEKEYFEKIKLDPS